MHLTRKNDSPLRNRIAEWLRANPGSTTLQVARGVGADHWDVQHEVLRMALDGVATQHRAARTSDGAMRPTYSLKEARDGG